MRRNAGEGVEVEASLFTPDGNVDCTVTVGISMEIPPKAKHRATYDPDINSYVQEAHLICRILSQQTTEKPAHPCSTIENS